MIRKLLYTGSFTRDSKRFAVRHPEQMGALAKTLEMLRQDAFDARLRTHKLGGQMAGSWSCSGGYDLRIVFEFVKVKGKSAILLHALGTHDSVY